MRLSQPSDFEKKVKTYIYKCKRKEKEKKRGVGLLNFKVHYFFNQPQKDC